VLREDKCYSPEAGYFKINSDGATFDGGRGAGMGVVIRDHAGSFTAGFSCRTDGSFSAEVVEILAIQEGCLLARDLGLSNIIVESDAQAILQAIQAGRFEGPCTGHIVAHIRELLGSFSIG
jgi:ribonuclease HI